jgi:hypothetical protein
MGVKNIPNFDSNFREGKNLNPMKKTLLILNSAFLILNCATAQTNVSGFISANTTWNLAGSPYVVIGNALLSHGYTLTIDPGVIVKFDTLKALQIDGELIAVGTAANRITFTSNDPTPEVGDWWKIQFSDTCVDALFDASGNYLSGCIMKYCDITYGGGITNGAIHIQSSSVYISNCNISYSSTSGIDCNGFVKVDSSAVRYCNLAGITLQSINSTYCPYIIQWDTLEFNVKGGIIFYSVPSLCGNPSIIIENTYFKSNAYKGAIYSNTGGGYYIISENEFINNSSQGDGGAITLSFATHATIECNRFINNQAPLQSTIMRNAGANDTIRNNFFSGNTSLANHPYASVMRITKSCCQSVFIENNYFINNVSHGGGTLNLSGSSLATDITKFIVSNNEFTGNQGLSNIRLDVSLSDFSLQFAHISNNNFLNSSTQYEIDNHAPFGGPNIDADSNYWNSTSTQHIDSVINDYFDFANYSVVFYSPILTAAVMIDTSCISQIPTATNNIKETNSTSTLFPNPFTTTATLKFSHAVSAATLRMYNMFGQMVVETSGISGESFHINAESFGSGVYVYEVTEKGKKICSGKAVVY